MVVFEVIGQQWLLFVRAFMIAAERNRWTSLSPKRGLTLYISDEIVLGMADREEKRRTQAQRNSVWRGDLDEKFPSIRMRTDRRGFQVVPALIDAGKRYSQV